MTESPRPNKIPSILRKSNAKAEDILAPTDNLDSQESPVPGKSQENELSDDITVHGMVKRDEAKSSAIKKFNKVGLKNQPAKDNSAGLKKSTLNGLNGKEFKAAKKTASSVKTDMEDDIETVGDEKKGNKKGKKSVDTDEERESEEKHAESDDEEGTKKGNRKVKVQPSKNAKLAVKGKSEEKKESTPEKKSSKKEEEEKEEEEEAPKAKELAKPKGKGKTFLGVKDNKESEVDKKSKEKAEKEKEKEKQKEKEKSKGKEKEKEKEEEEEEETKTKDGGSKLDLLKRDKKKITTLNLPKPVDKSTDKDKDKGKGKDKEKEKEKEKKSDKKGAGKKEASSKKDKKEKKDTDKKEKKAKKPKKEKKAEDPEDLVDLVDLEEAESADDEEEDEDVNESQLSQVYDDEEDDEDDSGDERDIMIYARGVDDDSNDIPREEVNADGEMQMISSKGGRSPVVDTYWKKHVRKSKGSSAKRKADEISNPHVYDAGRILKMSKMSNKVIMYSGLEVDDLDILDTAVAKLQGFIVNHTADPVMTHLIYNGTKRTMKLLFAIAKRAWILVPSFLYSSLEVGDWVSEKDCEFAGVKSKKFRDTYGPLFKDLRFYFNHGDLEYFQTINIDELKKLVKAAGGKLTEKAEEAGVIIEDADNRKNSLAPKKFEGNQPHVISYKWILDSLMQYTKLSYQDFEILM